MCILLNYPYGTVGKTHYVILHCKHFYSSTLPYTSRSGEETAQLVAIVTEKHKILLQVTYMPTLSDNRKKCN